MSVEVGRFGSSIWREIDVGVGITMGRDFCYVSNE